MRLVLALMLLLLVAPAFASHSQTHETGWFEYVWNEDDSLVLHCNGLGVVNIGLGLYMHDRIPSPPPYNNYPFWWLFDDRYGGTWIYQEANGIDGLQIGGPSLLIPADNGILVSEDPFSSECANGDTLVF